MSKRSASCYSVCKVSARRIEDEALRRLRTPLLLDRGGRQLTCVPAHGPLEHHARQHAALEGLCSGSV